jgi:hypothetical protein
LEEPDSGVPSFVVEAANRPPSCPLPLGYPTRGHPARSSWQYSMRGGLTISLYTKHPAALTLRSLPQHGDPALDIPEVQRVLEPRHLISTLGSNDLHHAQSLSIPSNEIQERQLVKVLCLLIRSLHNLVHVSSSRIPTTPRHTA